LRCRIPEFLDHAPQPLAHYVDGSGHLDLEDINMQWLRDDGQAAYGSALHWIVTGNPAHARKAAEIVNAWTATLKEIDPRNDGTLSTSYCWPTMIYAAEIISHTWNGWPAADQERFRALLLNIV
jgi:ribulose kinase